MKACSESLAVLFERQLVVGELGRERITHFAELDQGATKPDILLQQRLIRRNLIGNGVCAGRKVHPDLRGRFCDARLEVLLKGLQIRF